MLLDHFHPPLSLQRGWEGFYAHWTAALTAELNSRLPVGWWAEPELRFGIEADVGPVEEPDGTMQRSPDQPWSAPAPFRTIEVPLATNIAQVAVYNNSYSPSLMGAIELVSPANKERREQRDVFTARCATILSQGAGLIIVDIATREQGNLHLALMNRVGADILSAESNLYAAAWHPARGEDEMRSCVEIWEEPLEVGRPLPVLPLFLRIGPMMPIDLNASYRRACRELRIRLSEGISQDAR